MMPDEPEIEQTASEAAAAETPAPAETPPPAPAAKPDEPPKSDWRMIELGQTRRQLEESRTEAERLRDENRRLQELARAASSLQPPEPPVATSGYAAPPPPPSSSADFDRKVTEQVEQRLRQDKSQQLDEELRKNYAEDYTKILQNFGDIQGSMPLMFNDIMATDDPAYVTYMIGKDPEKLQQLRDMLPQRRIAALVKIAMEKPKATEEPAKPAVAKPSGAPPPPSDMPRGGSPTLPSGTVDIYDERLQFKNYYSGDLGKEKEADEIWFAERERQKRESSGRPWSVGGKVGTGGRHNG